MLTTPQVRIEDEVFTLESKDLFTRVCKIAAHIYEILEEKEEVNKA